MTEHYTTSRKVDQLKVFEYYSQFEKYQQRYSRYCAKFEIIEKTANTITTEEFWNLTLNEGKTSHAKVKVKYTLNPPHEIQYEILEGYAKGKKNRILIGESNGSTSINASMVMLEIFSYFYKKTDPVFQTYVSYFASQDTQFLEDKKTETKDGDMCPHCNKGVLRYTGGYTRDETSSYEYSSEREFLCDKCGKKITHHGIGLHN